MLTPDDLSKIELIVAHAVHRALHPSIRTETNVVPLRATPSPSNDHQPDEPPPSTAA